MSKLKSLPPQVENRASEKPGASFSGGSSVSSFASAPGVFIFAKFLGQVGLAFAFAVLTLGVCEASLAGLNLGMEEFMRPDALLGVAHLESKLVTHKSEGFSRTYISGLGLVDEEAPLNPEPGMKRIAFLGDSKTEALQVPDQDRFCRLIESASNKDGQTCCQTINFGTSSYGPLVECLQYLKLVRRFKPDVTVLVYNYGDVNESGDAGLNNNMLPRPVACLEQASSSTSALSLPTGINVEPGEGGNLRVDYRYLDNFLATDSCRFNRASEWLRRHSRIYQVFQSVDMAMRSDNKLYTKLADALVKPICNKIGRLYYPQGQAAVELSQVQERNELLAHLYALDRQVSHRRLQPPLVTVDGSGVPETLAIRALESASRENMELTARLISILNKACDASGGKLMVVGLPAPDNSMFYFRELAALKKLANREGFEFVDSRADFPKLQAMETNPYYYTAHFSPAGHRLMAKIIGRELKSYLKP
jgi:hypothetical protein